MSRLLRWILPVMPCGRSTATHVSGSKIHLASARAEGSRENIHAGAWKPTIGFTIRLITALLMFAWPTVANADRIALIGARLYISPDQPALERGVILIDGQRIKAVFPQGSAAIPPSFPVVDLSGATITAGFWNSHVHLTTPTLLRAKTATDSELTTELARAFTRFGFTTVFDLASTSEIASKVKAATNTGRVLGPRVLSVGEPFYPAGATPIYARPFYELMHLPSAEVASPREAAERARKQLGRGADGLKLFTGSIVGGDPGVSYMREAVARRIVIEARKFGKRTFAHPTDREGLARAIRSGVDVLAHSAPLMGPWTSSEANAMKVRGIALVPTLSLFAASSDPRTPVSVAIQQTATFYGAGGSILFGTDAGFTDVFDTRSELLLLNQAIGWRGVLASLTTMPAKFFGEATKRGKLAAGYQADLVVLTHDPQDDVTALARVSAVMKGGRWIYDDQRSAP